MEKYLQKLEKQDIIKYREDLRNFLLKNFTVLEGLDVYGLIDGFYERAVVYVRGDEICLAAFYMMVSDEALEIIKNDKGAIATVERFGAIEKMIGNNMHFFCIAAENMGEILIGLKNILQEKKPDSVSWLNPKMDRFIFIKGRYSCHQH